MMNEKLATTMVVTAFTSYLLGGIQTFFGLALLFFFRDRTLGTWGSSQAIAILLICVGLGLSVLGVLLMRVAQNRLLR